MECVRVLPSNSNENRGYDSSLIFLACTKPFTLSLPDKQTKKPGGTITSSEKMPTNILEGNNTWIIRREET